MTEFWINVQNTSGSIVGDGPIITATRWQQTARLNRAGSFSFEMPAADPRAALIQPKRTVWCYTIVGGSVTLFGAGIVDKVDLKLSPSGATMLSVSGDDLLRELTNRSVGFLELSDGAGAGTATALADVMALAPAGWGLDTVNGYSSTGDTVYGRFAGESILKALVKLAENEGESFRLGSGRSVVWLRNDTPDSGLRAIGDAEPVAVEGNDDVCLIQDLNHSQDSYELISRVYPFGAGNGRARITLDDATASDPAGYSTGSDSLGNYLESDAGAASYGRIERFISWKEIAAITNTDADLESAGNTLLNAGFEHLSRLDSPQQAYSLRVTKLPQIVNPGETIRVIWREVVDNYEVADIDANLVVLEATRELQAAGGIHTTSLKVSTIDRWPLSDADVIAAQMEEARLMEAHPQTIAGYYSEGFGMLPLDSNSATADNVEIRFRFDDRITRLASAKLRFRTDVFETYAAGVEDGGGGTETSQAGGGGTETSQSGGASTPTSQSGGASTPTSSGGGSHSHGVPVYGGPTPTSYDVQFDPDTDRFVLPGVGSGEDAAATTESVGAHTHDISIPSHTHDISIPSHTHDIDIPNHQHDIVIPPHSHDLNFTITRDTVYPGDLTIEINGTDYTAALGGPWGSTGSSTGEVEVEIADILNSNLRREHSITFTAASGKGRLVNVALRCFVQVQAILVT